MEARFTEVHKLLAERDFSSVNQVLEDFDPEVSEAIVGVGMLRAAFAARTKLPAWWVLLEKMEQRILDERILRGLRERET